MSDPIHLQPQPSEGVSRARLLLLSGPPASGKSTVLNELRYAVPPSTHLAIVERDTFAEMSGRAVLPAGDFEAFVANWRATLEPALMTVRYYLDKGFVVALAGPFTIQDLDIMQSIFDHGAMTLVMLMPSWDETVRRHHARLQQVHRDPRHVSEESLLTDTTLRYVYDLQMAVVEAGSCEVVIDNTELSPHQVANRLSSSLCSAQRSRAVSSSTKLPVNTEL